jgi:hypothetical protein
MIHLSGEREAGTNVPPLKVRVVGENFVLGGARSQQLEHILDPDAHTPDTWPPAALRGIEGDARRWLSLGWQVSKVGP